MKLKYFIYQPFSFEYEFKNVFLSFTVGQWFLQAHAEEISYETTNKSFATSLNL